MFGWEGKRENDGGAHLGPQKKISPKWRENLEENMIDEGQKCPWASCTCSSIWFFIFYCFNSNFFFLITDTSR